MSERLPLELRRLADAICPQCETAAVYASGDPATLGYAVCGECGAAWERVDRSMLTDASDPLSPFREPCNNCAFRPGSKEQQDADGWRDLIGRLKDGATFHCHKGVPINGLTDKAKAYSFDYPEREVTFDFADQTITTMVPDKSRLRLCAGYLRAIASKQQKARAA